MIAGLDGRAVHMRTERFESDRVRDRRLKARRWEPVRVTSWQLDIDADGLEEDLRQLGVGRAGSGLPASSG